jgi:hypothetical protein
MAEAKDGAGRMLSINRRPNKRLNATAYSAALMYVAWGGALSAALCCYFSCEVDYGFKPLPLLRRKYSSGAPAYLP